MERIIAFVIYVTAITVMTTFCEMLLPNGNLRGSAETSIGIAMLSAIVSQILSIINGWGI